MREKSFNITPDVHLSKVDSKWPSKTTKKNAVFLSFACLNLNSKGTLGNETPNSFSLFGLGRLQKINMKYKRCLSSKTDGNSRPKSLARMTSKHRSKFPLFSYLFDKMFFHTVLDLSLKKMIFMTVHVCNINSRLVFIRPSKMGRIMGSPMASGRAGGRRPLLCPEHISKTILATVMKFHGWIGLSKGECSAQES